MIENFYIEIDRNQNSSYRSGIAHSDPNLTFTNKKNKLLFFGTWLGSYIPSRGVVNSSNILSFFPEMSQKDINELCYYSFGQFYCLYIFV